MSSCRRRPPSQRAGVAQRHRPPPRRAARPRPGGRSAVAAAVPRAGGSATAPAATAARTPEVPASGPLSDFRKRLIDELGLTPAQTAQVDAVIAAQRPRFAELRNLAEAAARQGARPHPGRHARAHRRAADARAAAPVPEAAGRNGRTPDHARAHLPAGRRRQAARLQRAPGHQRRRDDRADRRRRTRPMPACWSKAPASSPPWSRPPAAHAPRPQRTGRARPAPVLSRLPGMALIEARSLVKTYRMGDQVVQALNDVSLDIDEGEFVAIMGASGSGKSTLMNILGCLDRPTSGHAAPGRRGGRRPGRRRAGVDPQPAHRLRLPAVQPAAAHQRAGQRRAADGLCRHQAGRAARARAGGAAARRPGRARARTRRPSCPAASSSAWRSRARWSTSRADPGRRAHRRARHADLRRHHAAAGRAERAGHDHRHGHARGRHRRRGRGGASSSATAASSRTGCSRRRRCTHECAWPLQSAHPAARSAEAREPADRLVCRRCARWAPTGCAAC